MIYSDLKSNYLSKGIISKVKFDNLILFRSGINFFSLCLNFK